MHVKWTDSTPRKIQQFAGADYPKENPDLEDLLTSADVDHIAEIFQTPLTGSYNWDYKVQDDRIKKLYDLGKQLNWDGDGHRLNRPWPQEVRQPEVMNLHEFEPTWRWTRTRAEFWLHMNSWSLSSSSTGAGGALVPRSCVPVRPR
jgi:hypothetical protein